MLNFLYDKLYFDIVSFSNFITSYFTDKTPKLIHYPDEYTICFYPKYNEPIVISDSKIKRIKFCEEPWDHIYSIFDKPIDNLPDTIEQLFLPKLYNGQIINLPKKLIELKLGTKYSKPLENLPKTLELLYLPDNYNYQIELPKKLKILYTNQYFIMKNKLPKKLLKLYMVPAYFNPTDNEKKIEKIKKFPKYLQELKILEYYNFDLDNLPDKLIYLELPQKYSYKIIYPQTLKKLCIWQNSPVKNNIPEFIDELFINFSSEIDDKENYIDNIPSSVRKISVDFEKNMKYIKKIPWGCKINFRINIIKYSII